MVGRSCDCTGYEGVRWQEGAVIVLGTRGLDGRKEL